MLEQDFDTNHAELADLRSKKIENNATWHSRHQDYKKLEAAARHFRNFCIVFPLITLSLRQPELSSMSEEYYIASGLGAAALSALIISTESSRRYYKRGSHRLAELAIENSHNQPQIPVPDWAKTEIPEKEH